MNVYHARKRDGLLIALKEYCCLKSVYARIEAMGVYWACMERESMKEMDVDEEGEGEADIDLLSEKQRQTLECIDADLEGVFDLDRVGYNV